MAEQLLSAAPPATILPENYVRPESQRPRLTEVVSDTNIPTIDLGSPDRHQAVQQIGEACRSYGFFQVVNHGVDIELMLRMMATAFEFFRLPQEEKAKHYSDDPAKKMRLSTSFNIRKETVRNWRDYLRLHCYPLEQYVPDWPSNPPSFKWSGLEPNQVESNLVLEECSIQNPTQGLGLFVRTRPVNTPK